MTERQTRLWVTALAVMAGAFLLTLQEFVRPALPGDRSGVPAFALCLIGGGLFLVHWIGSWWSARRG
jgi:hypothetical protein